MKKVILTLALLSMIYTTGNTIGNNKLSKVGTPQPVMLKNAKAMMGTPYVAHTLEVNSPEEKLVVNLKEVDCTTFVEYVLAKSLCKHPGDEEEFRQNLRMVRYRDGIINGYASRLHYTTEWVMNGVRHGFLTDVAALNSADTMTVHLSFMSTHPAAYKQLATSPQTVSLIKKIEQRLSGQVIHYIPKAKLPAEGFKWIKNGDIILLVTNIAGLDNSHLGIAIYKNHQLHLLHASSAANIVKIQEEPLSQQLMRSKSNLGIRVIRMKK